jgi:hypothetical protein
LFEGEPLSCSSGGLICRNANNSARSYTVFRVPLITNGSPEKPVPSKAPLARFKFVSGKGYRPQEGELRFDMFEAEFTHEGDKCTFEVLLERAGLKDSALRAIAEIIHDIDLKDDKFGRTEVAGIRTLIDGIRVSTNDDARRIERGAEAFNDLYEFFKKKRR